MNYYDLLIFISLAIWVNLFVWLAHPLQVIKQFLKLDKFKLFNCVNCLSFWVGFSFFFFHLKLSIINSFALAPLMSLIAICFEWLIKKFITESI